MNVGILTDFISHDPAYSLCSVVKHQVTMLHSLGYEVTVFVRPGFIDDGEYGRAEIMALDPGHTDNVVELRQDTERDIASLAKQMRTAFAHLSVILTHDLIYQPALWKYHVAARRAAQDLPDLRWLHWVHSTTPLDFAKELGVFASEIHGRFPHSRVVAFHKEEVYRKAASYGYEIDQAVVIPNAMDFTADFHPVAQQVTAELHDRDCVAIYPARLDRGKQPHFLIEIMARLVRLGRYRAHIIFVDFHSTAGDKAEYREEMRLQAERMGVSVTFTSDCHGPSIPHKAVMDMIEYSDFLIHPSKSEADGLIVYEAMWKRAALLLNYDLPNFRQHDGSAVFGKFSSNIDVHTGMPGSTETDYPNYELYMRQLAGTMLYHLQNNMVLANHIKVRQERSLTAVGRHLLAAIETP